MPTSVREGKEFARETVHKLMTEGVQVKNVLDIGPGRGNWYSWLEQVKWHGRKPPAVDFDPVGGLWHGVEAWEPYIKEFGLEERYDHIYNMDARRFRSFDLYDLVIFGDVLEHMTKEEAQDMWRRACESANVVIASVPIRHFPQGHTEHKNPFEKHVVNDWDDAKLMAALDPTPMITETGKDVGVYIWYRK